MPEEKASPSVAAVLRDQLRSANKSLAEWEKKYDKDSEDLDFVKDRISFYTEQVKYLQQQIVESK